MATTQAPPQNGQAGQATGQPLGPGKKKRNAALLAMRDNPLKTPEDLSGYLNIARAQLFETSEQMDLLAAELHSAYVDLRRRLLRAAARTKDPREKWAYRMMVRRSMRPFRNAAKAAASAADNSSWAARLLRRFWRTYMDITESVVPKRRGER